MRSVIPMLVGCLAAAFLAAGCGSKGSTTSTSSAVDWASGLCGAITTWRTSVTSAVDSVTSGSVSKASLQSAASKVKSANQAFADSLKNLGQPGTDSGAKAKDALDKLSTEIGNERDKINSAISGVTTLTGVIAAAPIVLDSLKAMRTDVSTTFTELQAIDASGELSDAFKQASSCTPLTKSS